MLKPFNAIENRCKSVKLIFLRKPNFKYLIKLYWI